MTIWRYEAHVEGWSEEVEGQQMAHLWVGTLPEGQQEIVVDASILENHGIKFGELKTALVSTEIDFDVKPPVTAITGLIGYLPTAYEARKELREILDQPRD